MTAGAALNPDDEVVAAVDPKLGADPVEDPKAGGFSFVVDPKLDADFAVAPPPNVNKEEEAVVIAFVDS